MDRTRITLSLEGIKRRLLEDHNCSVEVPKSLIKEVASRLRQEKLEDTVTRCLKGLDYNELTELIRSESSSLEQKELKNEKERQEGKKEKRLLNAGESQSIRPTKAI
jgi:hypothetical protein